MTRRYAKPMSLVLAALLLWGSTSTRSVRPVGAATPAQAGLVVQFADDGYVVRLVSLAGDSITGLELLTRSGLNVAASGSTVCRIEHDGCPYPEVPCFCQCDGSTPGCRFWGYWHLVDGRWAFAPAGAADHRVRDGEVDGWHWPGGPPTAQVTFAEIVDERRIAPGVPVARGAGHAVEVVVPYQGDTDGDGAVRVRTRAVGAAWPERRTELVRNVDRFAVWLSGIAPGVQEIQVEVSDPTGVNGSATWLLTATIASQVYLPCVAKRAASPVGARKGVR